jgi:hypothetical protein
MSAASDTIADAVVRLLADYRHAVQHVSGDESLVPLLLPAEWVKLAVRTFELIIVEAGRISDLAGIAGYRVDGQVRQRCSRCDNPVFLVVDDATAQGKHVECAGCGEVCHV